MTSHPQFEVHDPEILAQASAVLDACGGGEAMQDAVLAASTAAILVDHSVSPCLFTVKHFFP